jgi:hypothetical protein
VANNYKKDDTKPPLLDAVLIPYRRSLLAIAAMKADMKVKHELQGAKNPFLEWQQLPQAEARLGNAGARHVTQPWDLNTEDALPGTPGHLHMVHGITGLLMALEMHLKQLEEAPPAPRRTGKVRRCICGHRYDQHDVCAAGISLECVASIPGSQFDGGGDGVCACPEFREE